MYIIIRSVGKKIRSSWLINYLIRSLIKNGVKFLQKLSTRWPVNGIVLIRIDNNRFKLICREDDGISNKYYYQGFSTLAYFELSLFNCISQNSKIIFDIGANVGLFSFSAALANKKALIHAFEPSPKTFKRLSENKRINEINNLDIHQFAISDSTGKRSLFSPKGIRISDISSLEINQVQNFEDDIDEIIVDSYRLDDWVLENAVYPDLIKIDVELHELNVLEGAENVLSKGPTLFMENHNYFLKNNDGGMSVDFNLRIEKLLSKYNYNFYGILPKGVYKVASLQHQPALLNFIISTKSTSKIYFSKAEMYQFVEEITKNNNTTR